MRLPEQAEIVVIGGGIIGCSTAHHLARDHRADVVLLEQGQLSCGSTWHAAGLVGQLRSSASITQILGYSVDLYQRLAEETGLEAGWKMTGCLRLTCNEDRSTEFKRLATTAGSFGMEMHLISPQEVTAMWPLLDVSDLVGASYLPTDGQASSSDITQSLAKGARMHGVRIFEDVAVTGFAMDGDRIVGAETSQGTLACDKVVNCAGQWARQVGAMAGVTVPLQPVNTSTSSRRKSTAWRPTAPRSAIRIAAPISRRKSAVWSWVGTSPTPSPGPPEMFRAIFVFGCLTTTGIISSNTWYRRLPVCLPCRKLA